MDQQKESINKYSAGYLIGARGGGFLLLLLDDLGDSGDGGRFPKGCPGNGDESGGGTEQELVVARSEESGGLLGCN